mgnify:CR=1 FL=1
MDEWVETLKERTTQFLESNYEVEVIEYIAFGSVASGEFVPDESDLDVIVVVDILGNESPLFMSESAKTHVKADDTPAVGVDVVVTPEDEVAKAKAMFEHTRSI